VPHYFQLASGEPFAFAGIWEKWGEELETRALITTSANSVVGPVRHRMPVILHPVDNGLWLDPMADLEELQKLLGPYDGEMTDTPVGPYVNNAKNQGPKCIDPVR
jgi:putative SOS response-associated peptidase YedK